MSVLIVPLLNNGISLVISIAGKLFYYAGSGLWWLGKSAIYGRQITVTDINTEQNQELLEQIKQNQELSEQIKQNQELLEQIKQNQELLEQIKQSRSDLTTYR